MRMPVRKNNEDIVSGRSINVLFSGGYDSTLVLCDAVAESKTVNCITVEPSFSFGKVERERKARSNIINFLRRKYNTEINVSNIKIDISESHYTDGSYLTQPLFWLPSIFVLTPRNKDAEIRLGYIAGDQTLYHIHDLETMAKAVSNFKDKDMELVFPLGYMSKEDVIVELFENYREVINFCTTCENMGEEVDYCCECESCKSVMRALKYIASDDSRSLELRKWAVRQLKKYRVNADILLDLKCDDIAVNKCRLALAGIASSCKSPIKVKEYMGVIKDGE